MCIRDSPLPGALCDIGAYESDAADDGDTPTPTPTITATPSGTPPTPTMTPSVTPTGTPPTPTATFTATPPGECAPPYTAADEAQLNAAIACANAAGAGSHTITLTGDVTLSDATTPLNNPCLLYTSSIELETADYILGSISVPNYEEHFDAHVYVRRDGWIMAYYLSAAPSSKMIDTTAENLDNSKLKTAVSYTHLDVYKRQGYS